jgi:hypothetical protein
MKKEKESYVRFSSVVFLILIKRGIFFSNIFLFIQKNKDNTKTKQATNKNNIK